TTTNIFVSGRYAYTAKTGGIIAMDIRDPKNPVKYSLNTSAGTETFSEMYVQGRYAYVLDANNQRWYTFDLGGIETNALTVATAQVGSLDVLRRSTFQQEIDAAGGLSVGINGIHSAGGIDASSFSASSTARFINNNANVTGTAWGVFTNRLAINNVIPYGNVTGSNEYAMVVNYNSAAGGGLCLNGSNSPQDCPNTGDATSILADDAVTASAFDLAEIYSINVSSTPGDLLVLDRTASTTVKVSTGTPYDSNVIGIVSTRPGFVLGWNSGVKVALTGRVPTKVVPSNGVIRIGDPLTSSGVPGHAMKATKPGMIVGYALDDADATGTIEVFVDVGYNAGMTLKTDGSLAILSDDLLITTPDTASSTVTTVDSWGLTFRGSAWNAASSTAVTRDFTILNDMVTATTSLLAIRATSGTNVFTIDQSGTITVTGDLKMLGRLYPSARGSLQDQYYIYVDNSSSTNQYMSTNADGWQAQTSYDLAERYYSEDALEPGDLVMPSAFGDYGVGKATRGAPLMGIVSTKPGFLLGRNATDTYPIALSGRVPTKVNGQGGAIAVGDLLTVSDTPGVAMKATENGYIVGIALRPFDG
ncbi:MAG: hypothetical protein NUW08_02290, partial [Candidatus Uhrbacteria bacterium]|nr:hypothetical protein [Candidatus Uhrbacteria bacterium]